MYHIKAKKSTYCRLMTKICFTKPKNMIFIVFQSYHIFKFTEKIRRPAYIAQQVCGKSEGIENRTRPCGKLTKSDEKNFQSTRKNWKTSFSFFYGINSIFSSKKQQEQQKCGKIMQKCGFFKKIFAHFFLLSENQQEKKHFKRSAFHGRGIRIRTLNDGVRVRSVTVTLYLYVF